MLCQQWGLWARLCLARVGVEITMTVPDADKRLRALRGPVANLTASVIALAMCGVAARSEDYPTRPITFIVPYAVGGTVDVQLRALAAATEKHIGRPFIIENRPSATGTLGPSQVAASARPDGYTITQIHTGVLRLPFMTKTPYDPATDFTYIIGISGLVAGLVVRGDSAWNTFDDLIADAHAHPNKIAYGSAGGAVTPYIVMRQIAKRKAIDWISVPFKSFAESSNALLGGHIQAVSDAAGWAPLVNSGQLRLLVTYGATRTRNWPNVPILSEVGIDVVASSVYGIAGPKGMDAATVKVLHDAFRRGMQEPSFLSLLKLLEQEPIYLNSDDYRAYVMHELVVQKGIVEELGLKIE
jgi:tripartite-type tricarboxylate transporter receptor subunit TctC